MGGTTDSDETQELEDYWPSLPEGCPADEGATPRSGDYFRLIRDVEADWQNHVQRFGEDECMKKFHGTRCQCHALSVYGSPHAALQTKDRYPAFRKHRVVCVSVTSSMGSLKQTGADPNHFSWWPHGTFSPPPQFSEIEP